MSLKEKLSVVKSEEPEIYQTNRVEKEDFHSTNMFSEQIEQIVEKMNDLATEQYSVTKKYTLLETELEKALKERQEAIKKHNGTLAKLTEILENLRIEVNKNQNEQIHVLKDKTSSNGPGTRRANHTNESTWPGHDRTRDEIQAGTKANHEGTINGNRIANSSDCRANISPIRNTNPTPSVNGSELLNDLLKSVEQSAKQIEAQQKAEQAQSQRLRLPKRQQLQKDQEWER